MVYLLTMMACLKLSMKEYWNCLEKSPLNAMCGKIKERKKSIS